MSSQRGAFVVAHPSALCCIAILARAGIATLACSALSRLADVVDIIVSSGADVAAQTVALRDSVAGFLDACVAAGWGDYMTPKFHWLIHLPRHLARWGCLLSCFVHERKHRMVKRYSYSIQH